MKNGWKKFWIICAVTAGIGIVLCIVSASMGATWGLVQKHAPSWISLGTREIYEVKIDEPTTASSSEETFSGVKNLYVDADVLNLQVFVNEDYSDKVVITNLNEAASVQYVQSGESLKIKQEEKVLKSSDEAPELMVFIPVAYFDEIDINVSAGTVYIEELDGVGELNLNVDAGEIVVGNFIADEAELTCGAGRIDASGVCSREIDIECGAGEINLTINEKRERYNYEIDCGLGEVIIDNKRFSGLGDKEIYENKAAKEMSIECGMGSVLVTFMQE